MAQECTPDVMSQVIIYAIHSFSSREKAYWVTYGDPLVPFTEFRISRNVESRYVFKCFIIIEEAFCTCVYVSCDGDQCRLWRHIWRLEVAAGMLVRKQDISVPRFT